MIVMGEAFQVYNAFYRPVNASFDLMVKHKHERVLQAPQSSREQPRSIWCCNGDTAPCAMNRRIANRQKVGD